MPDLAEVATPSSTIQLSPSFHSDISPPSKRTIASAGGDSGPPGLTTGGSGQMIPLLYSRCHAKRTPVAVAALARTSAIVLRLNVSGRPDKYWDGRVMRFLPKRRE